VPVDPGWTSLEVAKLLVSALTPLAVVVLGFYVARISRRVEAVQWANQTVVARRLQIFDQVAPKLNQLLCFATFVGRWKEMRPEDAVALKRALDEVMYANRVLFSDALFDAYLAFMATLFATFARVHEDAPLRVPVASELGDRRRLPWWDDMLLAQFDTANPSTLAEVNNTYHILGERFRADLYVTRIEQPLIASAPGRDPR
jgi:hypothetical protein